MLSFKTKTSEDFLWYYQNGYITSRDGNACVREGKNFFVTPSGARKQELIHYTPVLVDKKGNVIGSDDKPSIETLAHIYALGTTKRQASVHVHSPNTVALYALYSSARITEVLNSRWPELFRYTKVGQSVYSFDPGSHDLHQAIKKSFSDEPVDIVVMERHGVIARGNTLEDCREHIERLEHISGILLKIINASGGNLESI